MSDAADDAARARVASAWLVRERAHLLSEWLAAGGSEAEFLEVWDDVREQLIGQRLDSVGGRARHRSLSQSRLHRPFTATTPPTDPTTDELHAVEEEFEDDVDGDGDGDEGEGDADQDETAGNEGNSNRDTDR